MKKSTIDKKKAKLVYAVIVKVDPRFLVMSQDDLLWLLESLQAYYLNQPLQKTLTLNDMIEDAYRRLVLK